MSQKNDKELLANDLSEVFSDFYKKIRNVYREVLEEEAYTKPQVEVMRYLKINGKSKMTDIGKELMVTKSYITALADKLCGAGLIYREHDVNDRRSVLIGLTEDGEEIFKRYGKIFRNNIQKRMEQLSQDEKSDIKKMVELMKKMSKSKFFDEEI
jgi:DNA-binding MarR family transcriptional regulator